jgi:hypothetical protein
MCGDVKVEKPCDRLLGSAMIGTSNSSAFSKGYFSSRTKQIACPDRFTQ